jgi:hypothetical protein
VVVLRSGDQEPVRVHDGLPQLGHARRDSGSLHILVVERNRVELVDLDPQPLGSNLLRGPQERSIVRAFPQAARDADDA